MRFTAAICACITFLAAGVSAAAAEAPARISADCPSATSWNEARGLVGSTATVRGPVVSTNYAASSLGSPTFLDVGRRYPDPARFSVVIWGASRNAFGGFPEDLFRGRTICATGLVTLYRGVVQMELTNPEQITIVKAETATGLTSTAPVPAPVASPSEPVTRPSPPDRAKDRIVARVIDGDTIQLLDGTRVRLVQIDAPERWGRTECFGIRASALAKRLLPHGTRVRLQVESAAHAVDQYGRLLRYVVRVEDGVNVNLRLVALGAAAPYYYAGRRGRYAGRLETLVAHARTARLGLWKACPATTYNPLAGIDTRR